MTSLRHLSLSYNKLNELPDNLQGMTSLTFLALNNNQLSELPPSLCRLPALASLRLGNNHLTTLPPKFFLFDLRTCLQVRPRSHNPTATPVCITPGGCL